MGKQTLLLVLIALTACGNSKSSAKPATEKRHASRDVKQLLALVPERAVGVAFFDSPTPLLDGAVGGWMAGSKWQKYEPELRKELTVHLETTVGIDVGRVASVVAFTESVDAVNFAVLATGVRGILKGTRKGKVVTRVIAETYDAKLVVSQRGATVAFGTEKTVAKALARVRDEPVGVARQLLSSAQGAYAAANLEVPSVAKALGFSLPVPGLTHASFTYGSAGLSAELAGSDDALAMVETLLVRTLGQMVGEAERAKEKLKRESAAAGALAIWAYHNSLYMADELAPVRSPGHLRISYPLAGTSSSLLIVSVVGVLAAVAVPAFMKYTKKSKTSEARQFVKKLYDGARAFYMDGPRSGGKQGFPASTGITPPLGRCCEEGGKCRPNADYWAGKAWVALQFSVEDPHYYSYEFVNKGNAFEARAYGDLDCDGVYSTFSMYGEINAQNPDVPPGTGALFLDNELE